ncbi:MAG TPA: dicarboxylate/amino acid:cation symporter [Planctomycetota bacterium]|nr:dicarboxylate/amino acid:cation symporter [Planctomycetota bacterium]
MKFHWKVLLWMVAGVLVGLGMQRLLPAPAWSGASWQQAPGGLELLAARGPAAKAKLVVGGTYGEALLWRGSDAEERLPLAQPEDFAALLGLVSNGDVVWLVPRGVAGAVAEPLSLTVGMDPTCARARWIKPFTFAADIFLALLKMLIVPLVMSSIITGVAGVGSLTDLRRLGTKTFSYYIFTSLLAILVGQVLVNLIKPGDGAQLGLSTEGVAAAGTEESFIDILRRMVPSNIIESMSSNGAMLQIIFFALLFGYFITRTPAPHGGRMREWFASLFEVMMRMAEGILKLLPYGVFALLVKVVAGTGFGVFKPLLLYMGTVTAALLIHACLTLPLIVRFLGRMSPRRWFQAMSPALMTAFSTSSSSMTLPVTLRTVEQRGRVSNKVSSFTLPLGATINMDGTALYECIGVIFLAQYYASAGGYELTPTAQATVVILALLASVGAAGIPSAGLVMMLTILSTLGLPIEGAALLLAVDRPLDMLRTVVNVWSDSCGAAVIARSEGEAGPLEAGAPA